MPVTTVSPSQVDQPPPMPVWRFTVDAYHRLGEIGILDENDRVELLEGWIAPKMGHNPPHDGTIDLVNFALRPVLPSGWMIRIQSSITTDGSEPEPDIAVVRGESRTFLSRHPEPGEVGLIVEVADPSLATDRGTKARLYARARIPAYWIVNVRDRQLEVLTEPSGPADSPQYLRQQTLGPEDAVRLLLGDNDIAHIAVKELLP